MKRTLAAAAMMLWLAPAPAARAHFERPGSFPDPAADASVSPPAGGAVPVYRRSGRARVVCQPRSLQRARRRGAGSRVLERNRRLARRCRFASIQAAVRASGNGDRVLVLPGVYREEASRAEPTFDARCREHRIRSEEQEPGTEPQALSYRYQALCPNDQNLIAVIGRDPDDGHCLRCGLLIEGTGARPGDVLIDARAHGALQGKDVGVRADRADGFLLHGVRVDGAGEHGIYVIETDGYAVHDAIASANGNYGFLTFVSDHGRLTGCEAYLNANAGVYPGAAPNSGTRLNQRVDHCDSHHNVLGYSGTMGNSVLVEHNRFHDNTVGINTDSFLAAGHPGFPQDHAVFRANEVYSNNLNPYVRGSPLRASFPFPVGTGINVVGGNDNLLEGNYIYDNWRRGTALVSVPGFVVEPPQPALDPTSHRNTQRGNHMGLTPSGRRAPNGVDFWWDEAGTGNCWQDNGAVTSDPTRLDACPGRQVGLPAVGNPLKQAVLASCATWPDPTTSALCDWFRTPPKPTQHARLAGLPAGRPARPQHRRLDARDTCREWGRATPRARRATVANLHAALTADPQFRSAQIIPLDTAVAAIARTCRRPLAAGFSLFELFAARATFHAARR